MPPKDDTIAAEVPSDIASKGTLSFATDAEYAPMEYVDPANQQIVGADVDLGNALAAVMGLQTTWQNATFNAIIPGLAAGRYDMSMSAFTDTLDRQKTVDFVTYFSAGTSFYTQASGGPTITGLSSLCGLAVGVESGTTQEADATAQSKKCTAAGKQAVNVQSFETQDAANLAMSSGRVEVVMADSPVADWAVKQSNGRFKIVGTSYGTAPYGIAIPRPQGTPEGQAPMSKPTLDALNKLMADGTYQAILEKWGIQDGAISNPQINGATS
jgi:polar amino acid transport system substrate-binding protein